MMAVPPADAPRDALVSGKFAGPGNLRIDRPGAVMGDTGPLQFVLYFAHPIALTAAPYQSFRKAGIG
jgi:hypothetical protein